MELKNTEDLREFLRNTIHERWTNVTAVSKKANVAQPSFQKFIKGTNGKSISTYTMFPVFDALGVRLVAYKEAIIGDGSQPIIHVQEDAKMFPLSESEVFYPTIKKEPLSSELRNRIEEYKSSEEPKKPFSVDLIIEFFEESYDKLATI